VFIIGGFGLLLLVLAAVTIGASFQVRKHQSELNDLEFHSNQATLLQTAEAQAGISALLLQRYVTTGDESYVVEINDHADAAQKALEQALANGGPDGLDVVVAKGSQLVQDAARATELRRQGEEAAASEVMESMVPLFRGYRLQLEELSARELQQAAVLRSEADGAGKLAFWLLVLSGSIGVVLGIGASVWVARSIIRPLDSLERTAVRVSEGDLTARVPARGPRELAHLGAVLNHMMERIEQHTEELRAANQELTEKNRDLIDARNEAATDPLTGLGNHRSFHNRLREEVARASTGMTTLGLIIIDLDGFKDVNDSLGHLAGDQILRDLALRLVQVTRNDSIFRYGGDELAVLLPGAKPKDAIAVGERLREAVLRVPQRGDHAISASLGVACFPSSATTPEDLVYRADMAMYWAKSTGKNRVAAWDSAISADIANLSSRYGGRKAQPDVVGAFCATLGAKDPDTIEHTERCSWYTAGLAVELGLSDEEVANARLASLLHDIGKLTVPDDILRKPGPLTEREMAVIKNHPVDGANMLTQVQSLAGALPGVRHHHEHFDGSGYPDGMSGEAIPIVARILLVADAYDTMVSGRPYSEAIAPEEAIRELERHAGKQFDPNVVAAFTRLMSRTGGIPEERRARERVTPGA
jgi:diguanylate cyclase (GGDEF)-like protein/putative nucleotidyltransferase with HDIG domain